MPSGAKRILLLMHTWAGYLEGVQRGVAAYLQQRPEWVCEQVLPSPDAISRYVRRGNYDGAITYLEPSYLRPLQRLGVPVVDISNWRYEMPFPRVLPDDHAIGRMAAEYLIGLGLRHFGSSGPAVSAFSDMRYTGFARTLWEAGLTVSTPDRRRHTRSLQSGRGTPGGDATAAWLLQLPKPAGVFVTSDSAAVFLLRSCHRMGLRVPEDVCVLGVDNDELQCAFAQPPLSSIALPTQAIGFEAARLLHRLMRGVAAPAKPICLPPVGVVARQSTNLLLIPDEDVLAAVRYIQAHAHERVSISQLLSVVAVNRRYLEIKFRKHLGRTPLRELRRVRLAKAKELLSGTDLSMPSVARKSGLGSGERLATVFRKETGLTPTAYRRQFRLREA